MKTLTVDTSIWNAILQAGLIVQVTLFVLILMSVLSWAIILTKWYHLKNQKEADSRFLNRFHKAKKLADLNDQADEFVEESALARIYQAAYEEFKGLFEERKQPDFDRSFATESLERELHRSIRNEIGRLETRLTWLASTGSTAPFIGLFGTVWGLMNSFHKIGAMGSASLAVVAPGISEALVATAVGLFTAIPATLFYNQFVSKVRSHELEMTDLSTELVGIMKKQLGSDIGQG
jgi:biopolymer transport protein TolQ